MCFCAHFKSGALSVVYLMLWLCAFAGIIKRIGDYAIMFSRLITMAWATCLFHHFSLVVPVKNSLEVELSALPQD